MLLLTYLLTYLPGAAARQATEEDVRGRAPRAHLLSDDPHARHTRG